MSIENTAYCMILTACSSIEEAERIAWMLVEERAAACVQMAGIKSIYRWKGNTEKSGEILLLIKTRSLLYGRVESLISAIHSYEVPEIVALPIMDGLKKYIAWVDEVTQET
jgi:periplasmic divalent cation tolerance protein